MEEIQRARLICIRSDRLRCHRHNTAGLQHADAVLTSGSKYCGAGRLGVRHTPGLTIGESATELALRIACRESPVGSQVSLALSAIGVLTKSLDIAESHEPRASY